MRLTLDDLKNRLEKLKPEISGIYHLSSTGKVGAQYIVYYSPLSEEDGADLKKLFSEDNFIIELYTRAKNRPLERKLKGLFPEFKLRRSQSITPDGRLLNAFYLTAVNELEEETDYEQ